MFDPTQHPGFEFGYPGPSQAYWYAIWSPLFDCFLQVNWDLNLIKELQLLLSSKTTVTIVALEAKYYQTNLVDNSCCINWTITDLAGYEFNRVWFPTGQQFSTVKIMRKKTQSPPGLDKLLPWVLVMVYNLRQLQKLYHEHRVENFVEKVFDPSHNKLNQLQSQIYQILLINECEKQAQEEIDQLLENYHAQNTCH